MKQIRLINLTLRGWRGAENLTLNFGGESALISGRNASGKSRVMDAFLWLLFGKDSQDRKDYELRTRTADGKVQHHTECSVQGTLSIDGEVVTLRREYKEQWVRPRGQKEEVFKGNVTECSWNDVPVRVGDFQKRVNSEIIDDTLFRLITNPSYFFALKWQQQRDMLLSMAATRSDEEIAAGNKDFTMLLDKISGGSLIDYRREIAARIKRIKAEMADIPARIAQTEEMCPKEEDWAEIENSIRLIGEHRNTLQDQLGNASKRQTDMRSKDMDLAEQIAILQAKQRMAVKLAEDEARKEADQLNEERRIIEAELQRASRLNAENNIDLRHNEERVATLSRQRDELMQQLDALRQEWHTIKSEEYVAQDVCPTCGQHLPEEMVAKSREAAEQYKKQRLDDNNKRGKDTAAMLQSVKRQLENTENALQVNRQRANEYKVFIDEHHAALREHPAAQPKVIIAEQLPDWKTLQGRINEINESRKSLQSYTDDEQVANIKAQLDELAKREKELALTLARRQLIDKCKQEVERLREHGREVAQMLAEAEREEYVATQFSHARISDCESRINNMFHKVRFRLFDCTQDGAEYECCTPTVDGTNYAVLNTASKINAGMDIINTICRYNNIQAPIFCDNAESINVICSPDDAQLIRLQVTDNDFNVSLIK